MTAAWMGYAIVVGACMMLAGLAAERAAIALRRPARWGWLACAVGTVCLPLAALLAASLSGPPAAGAPVSPIEIAQGTGLLTDRLLPKGWVAALTHLDAPLLVAWLAVSLGLFGLLTWSGARTARAVSRWSPGRVGDVAVRHAPAMGPALIGWLNTTIVVPNWVAGLDEEDRRLIVRHELEHRTTGDTRLVGLALLLAVLFPWNPALWLQLRRLRAAIEFDCDRRLLRAGVDPARYATLLVEVADRQRRPVLAAAMAKPTTLLARRIDLMFNTQSHAFWKSVVCGTAAVFFVGIACSAPTPPEPIDDDATAVSRTADQKKQAEAAHTLTKERRFRIGNLSITDRKTAEGDGSSTLHVEPLLFIDGDRVERSALSRLEKSSIERVEVLKGTAARERLGEAGEAGAIYIFTKPETR